MCPACRASAKPQAGGGHKAPKEGLAQFRLTIKSNKMSHKGKEDGEVEETTFTIDRGKDPKAIDMTLLSRSRAKRL